MWQDTHWWQFKRNGTCLPCNIKIIIKFWWNYYHFKIQFSSLCYLRHRSSSKLYVQQKLNGSFKFINQNLHLALLQTLLLAQIYQWLVPTLRVEMISSAVFWVPHQQLPPLSALPHHLTRRMLTAAKAVLQKRRVSSTNQHLAIKRSDNSPKTPYWLCIQQHHHRHRLGILLPYLAFQVQPDGLLS